jgi:hypothetical protein
MDNAQKHNICTNVPSSQILHLVCTDVIYNILASVISSYCMITNRVKKCGLV